MTTILVKHITNESTVKVGYITLTGEYGRKYRNQALCIPGYGWVPCSRKLQSNLSTSPDDLMLVITEPNDDYKPVTSDVWVTRSNIVRTF